MSDDSVDQPPEQPKTGSRLNLQPTQAILDELKNTTPSPPTAQSPTTATPSSVPQKPSTHASTPDDLANFYQSVPAYGHTVNNTAPQASATNIGFFEGIPKGIIVIAALTLLNAGYAVIVLADGSISTSSTPTIISVVISSILAVGLFTLHYVARVLFMVMATLALFSNFMGLFHLMDVQHAYSVAKSSLHTEIDQLEQAPQKSLEDKATLELDKRKLDKYESVSGATFAQYYVYYLMSIGYDGFIVIYLLRPSIKDRFEP